MIEAISLAIAFVLGMLFQNFLTHRLVHELKDAIASSEHVEREEDDDNWWKNGEAPPWEKKNW